MTFINLRYYIKHMNKVKITFIASLFVFSFFLCAQDGEKAGGTGSIVAADLDGVAGLPLTGEEILALPAEGTTAKKGITYTYRCRVMPYTLPKVGNEEKYQKDVEKFKKKYTKKNITPFKLFADITEKNPKDNKTVKSTQGSTEFFFIDAKDKTVVLKKEVKNGALCAS